MERNLSCCLFQWADHVADFPGARRNINFLGLFENVAIVKVNIDIRKEAHTNSVWLEWVVEKWHHTNVGVQISRRDAIIEDSVLAM